MELPTKTKDFWDFYNEIEPTYYSNQLEPKEVQQIRFNPQNIKVQKDKNNHSNQNVVFDCHAIRLVMKDDIIQNTKTELRLPRRTFVKMFRKAGVNLQLFKDREVKIKFCVKNKYRYDLISIE